MRKKYLAVMHLKNIHIEEYNFDRLLKVLPELNTYITHENGFRTLDYSDAKAVFLLNKALLISDYNIKQWELPSGALCPPIPGRADYVHHLNDLLNDTMPVKGLDIGTGASAIYPILATSIYKWHMVGCDTNPLSIEYATKNTVALKEHIEIRSQGYNGHIFKGIIGNEEHFDFTMCNPPFYTSEKEALKANSLKIKNLRLNADSRNFAGQPNELWCNGGEALFIKRMIKESILFKSQVGWFTSLVSQKQNLPKIYKQLEKLNATYKIIPMQQGNKKSRLIAWTFIP